MESKRTIVVVLKSGGDFAFRDVELIARHINGKWQSPELPHIICLWDKASNTYDIGNMTVISLRLPTIPGTWSRIQLYSPEMEQYKPFLYIDLDTAVIQSLEKIFDLVKDESRFITLEDFWQKGELATGLVWFPKNNAKTMKVWKEWSAPRGRRMDVFIRKVCKQDLFWQQLTTKIYDFKPKTTGVLSRLPDDALLVCFHGKPRIFQVAEASMSLGWVKDYVNQMSFNKVVEKKKVTVIIPYNEDRGWLKDAVESVPNDVQLILSQGLGNWPQNFNRALPEAEGQYIKYLHEDDILSPNCITDSVKAIEDQGVDFIHGNAIHVSMRTGKSLSWKPRITHPTMRNLLEKNTIHSATLMYRREVFERIGSFSENNKLKSFEEYEFNLRCLQAGMKIGYCNSVLAYYRRHSKQLIRTTDKELRTKYRKEVIDIYKQGREFEKKVQQLIAV